MISQAATSRLQNLPNHHKTPARWRRQSGHGADLGTYSSGLIPAMPDEANGSCLSGSVEDLQLFRRLAGGLCRQRRQLRLHRMHTSMPTSTQSIYRVSANKGRVI